MGGWTKWVVWLATLSAAACGAKESGTTDTDGAVGADTDDGDDTDDGEAGLDASGAWAGSCDGDVMTGGSGSTSTNAVAFDLALDLVEGDYDYVTGAMVVSADYEGVPYTTHYEVFGWRTGGDLVLEIVSSTTTTATYGFPVVIELTLAGDTLAGRFVYFPYGTYGNPTSALTCSLTR